MFVKGDVVLGGDGMQGRVTQVEAIWLGACVAVRWADGSQALHNTVDLRYADHPNFESTEEVEAWLST